MSRFAAPIAEQIWDMKYRFRPVDAAEIGPAPDETVEDSWRRVAKALAEAEPEAEREPGRRGSTRRSRTSPSCRRGGFSPVLAPSGR